MLARRLALDVTALAPILFFSYVAYCSRVNVDRFHVVEMGTAAHAKVSQYIPAVRAVSDLHLGSPEVASDDEIRRVGRSWIREWRAGVLADLPQTCYEDTTVDGVKGQIVVARNQLHRSLIEAAHRARDAGDEAQAVEDLVSAYEVARVLRGSDLAVAASSAAFQMMALEELRLLGVRPSPAQFARIIEFEDPTVLAPRVSKMLLTAARLYQGEIGGRSAGRASEKSCYTRFSRIIQDELPSDDARARMRAMIATVRGDNPSLLYAARLAWDRIYELEWHRRQLLGIEPGSMDMVATAETRPLALARR